MFMSPLCLKYHIFYRPVAGIAGPNAEGGCVKIYVQQGWKERIKRRTPMMMVVVELGKVVQDGEKM